MLHFLAFYFLLFIIYAILGWCVEVVDTLTHTYKFVNRGFLIGPYCPIYGFGCLAMIFLLSRYLNDPIILFVMSMVLFSILEYSTSWLMEKIFHARWWDYSDKKFNLNGRICLETMIPFGFGGLIVMYLINPNLNYLLNSLSIAGLYSLSGLVFLAFLTDNIISFNVVCNFTSTINHLRRDSTEEISRYVHRWLLKHPFLHLRLASAFPQLEIRFNNIKQKLTHEINTTRQELKGLLK